MKNIKQKIAKILPEKVENHQFAMFIFGSLAIAVTLMLASLWAYEEFGTAQLDLSRPSLQEAREQAKKQAEREKLENAKQETFETEGVLDQKAFEKFDRLYLKQIGKLNEDFFSEDALSDKTLNLVDENEEN